MSWVDAAADASLSAWRADGLERTPVVFSSAQEPSSLIDATPLTLFSSSNYLGLAEHPKVVAAASAALDVFGAGSGGSRLTTGTTELHRGVEEAFAGFFGYPDAVFFSTGFHANTAVLHTLASGKLVILSDERNHASIIDGCRLAKTAGARVRIFRHMDFGHLEDLLAAECSPEPDTRVLVVSDGLFSMDGTIADVPALVELCRHYGAALMIDDAHGTGTLGATGRGVIEHFGLGAHADERPDILIATASKALGVEGGAVVTSAPVANLLRQKARPFVYSTSPTPATCAAVIAALAIIDSADSPVPALQHNIAHLAARLGMGQWHTPILPVRVGDERAAVRAAAALRAQGFFVPAIRYPTVPRGEAMLRVTVMATHTSEQIDALADALTTAISSDTTDLQGRPFPL